MTPRRLPPLQLREGETIFIHWPRGTTEFEIQLRQPGHGNRVFTARVTYPVDLLRRPPSTGTADWMRTELEDEFNTAMEVKRSNHHPRKPRW